MAPSTISWLRAATVVALATRAVAQQCYYPNGKEAPKSEKPCSSAPGSACCPDKWQCLDNGLCYYPDENLHGRYSCSDKSWKSPGCPSNLCTYNMNAFGGESITQCDDHDDNWCCNADATHVDCCDESPEPRPFFRLQDGKAYATIGGNKAASAPTLASISGLAASTSSSSPSQTSIAASSSAPSSASANSATAAAPSPITSVGTSITSGAAGPETIYITAIITPSSSPTATSSGSSSGQSNIGLIVGCAVGIPLGLGLIGILIWMLRKRRQQNMHPYKDASGLDNGRSSPEMAAAALGKKAIDMHPGTSEIDSQPVGPGRPISTLKGRAELDSGMDFQPGSGTPYAPGTAFIGGGNGDRSTWSSAPPSYSPGQAPASWAPPEGIAELDSSTVMPAISEKGEGEQTEQAQAQAYQAYRPPAAEMHAMKTPPEDVEKQL